MNGLQSDLAPLASDAVPPQKDPTYFACGIFKALARYRGADEMATIAGIDFGTTNTVIALQNADGAITTARFTVGERNFDTFRSVLCFWNEAQGAASHLHHAAGPAAIAAYLDGAHDCRLIMSMKSFLAQRTFADTRVFGRTMTLPGLIAHLLRFALDSAGVAPGSIKVVAGRPVRFVGDTADDALGETRLRQAFAEAGIERLELALEPEAAGFRFARGLTRETKVLIGDFGGGTSDFSVLRFQPGGNGQVESLSHIGVGIAGDTFDFRIIDNVVSPMLGKGTTYKVFGNALPVPPEYFASFARWHRLSLMRTPRTLQDIEQVARMSEDPEKLRGLIRLIDQEKGYDLYRAVSEVKAQLSSQDEARLHFDQADIQIDAPIRRVDFESWIDPELTRLDAAIGQALETAQVDEHAIDRVFLTGGTSFVPAVRALFTRRFGEDKLSAGGEFVAVAEGLARIGQSRFGSEER